MRQYSSQNSIVDAMDGLDLKGNITPVIWYQTIRTPQGKPDSIAIALLADIVYWYRPKEVRDEVTGQLLGIRKKFKADLLQRSYAQFADMFGYSKTQVRHAIVRLEVLGVIKRVFRTVNNNGQKLSNVMFIELIPERLVELTYPYRQSEPLCTNLYTGVYENSHSYIPKSDTGMNENVGTNTKTTTENNNKDYPILSFEKVLEDFKEQIGYEAMIVDYPSMISMIDGLVEVAAEVLTSNKSTIRVNSEDRPTEIVRSRFKKLNMFHMQYVLEGLGETKAKLKNPRAVMITSMYNAPATMDNYVTAKVNHDMRTA